LSNLYQLSRQEQRQKIKDKSKRKESKAKTEEKTFYIMQKDQINKYRKNLNTSSRKVIKEKTKKQKEKRR
jgi:hypothetical protein